MIETREMTPVERRWLRYVLRETAMPRRSDRQALWFAFLSVAGGIGIFRLLHELVFGYLMPGRPGLGMGLSVAAGSAFALGAPLSMHRLRGQYSDRFKPHRVKLEQDARAGVVEVHSDDDVESYFDLEQDPEDRDLVVRFSEGEVRVDGAKCEQEGISEPVRGWCRIVCLPCSGQVLEITTKAAPRTA